jgi:CRP-like cAMP-binding protein
VEVNGKSVAEIQQGQFIGKMGFITDEVPSVDIVAIEPTRCMWWPKSKLQDS